MATERQTDSNLQALLHAAKQQVRLAAPATVAASLERYLVIDVREPCEVLQGYLPGAVNVPRGTLEFRATSDARFSDRQQPILAYSGVGNRSVLAALALSQLGFGNVQSLDGGFHRWSQEDRPIE